MDHRAVPLSARANVDARMVHGLPSMSGVTLSSFGRHVLTFNQLLHRGGLEPANVRLVRHKPAHHHRRELYDAAMKNEPRFREYQEVQDAEQVVTQFRAAKHLAGFFVEPTTKQTLFVGVWDVTGEREVKPPYT